MKFNYNLVIFSSENYHWRSCRRIEDNLLAIYRQSSAPFDYFDLYTTPLNKLKELLKNKKQVHLIFVSFKIGPDFLDDLKNLTAPGCEIYIRWHAYANFIKLINNNNCLDRHFNHYKFSISAFSKTFSEVIEKHFTQNYPVTFYSPLPTVIHEDSQGDFLRRKLKLKANDKILLYAGRLSFQKNIVALLELFSQAVKKNQNLHLVLAGAFDDIGFPDIGLTLSKNAYCTYVMNLYNQFPETIKRHIFFIGDLSQKELKNAYQESDLFISLGTCTQEDYGASPIDAQMFGLPTILTDWGGFKDIKRNFPKSTFLVPVKIQKNEIFINEKVFNDRLKSALKISKKNVKDELKKKVELKSQFKNFSSIKFQYKNLMRKKKFNMHFFPQIKFRKNGKLSNKEKNIFSLFIGRAPKGNFKFSLSKTWENFLSFYLKSKSGSYITLPNNKNLPWYFQIPWIRYSPEIDISSLKSKRISNGPKNKKRNFLIVVIEPELESNRQFFNWMKKNQNYYQKIFILNGQNNLLNTQKTIYENFGWHHYSWGKFLYCANFNDYEVTHYPSKKKSLESYPEEYMLDRGAKAISINFKMPKKIKAKFKISPFRDLIFY